MRRSAGSATREGSRSKNAGPRGCYRTSDDRWIAVSGSTPKMAERFLRSYGLESLLDDPRFSSNEARVQHSLELDAAIAEAIASRTLSENVAIIEANKLTAMPVQTVADIERDPHWQARDLTVSVPNGHARFGCTTWCRGSPRPPARSQWSGGALGQDNATVFGELGLNPADLDRLRAAGVI